MVANLLHGLTSADSLIFIVLSMIIAVALLVFA
jgi:hypothetical protein